MRENDVMPLPPMPVPTPRPAPLPRPIAPADPSADPLPTATVIHALAAATDRLLATIDTMTAGEFAEPSLLPGWSRAHVLAHLAMNAKGLAGVLTTLGQADPLPMYASNERRDGDIDALAAQPPARVADRVAVGASMLAQHLGGGPTPEGALEAVGAAGQLASDLAAARERRENAGGDRSSVGIAPQRNVVPVFEAAAREAAEAIAAWSARGTFDRVPGGPAMPVGEIPFMRWREVEIHHADLGLDYRAADWPAEFATYLLGVAAYDRGTGPRMTIVPTGLNPLALGGVDGSVRLEIHGSAADLAWWLVGRGDGEGLTAVGGALPALGPWVRR
jgi:maleylpyruvate isomerase